GSSLLTVTIVPAAAPPSTGITVNVGLQDVGGAVGQQFYDDGTHGDATAGDNVFSYLHVVPTTVFAGGYPLTANIADAQLRTAQASMVLTVSVSGPHNAAEHLVLGNPSGATANA